MQLLTRIFFVVVSVLTAGGGLVAQAENAPITCTIQTYNGRYLTAVGGGGRITDVIHSDATRARSWEQFTLIDPGEGSPIR